MIIIKPHHFVDILRALGDELNDGERLTARQFCELVRRNLDGMPSIYEEMGPNV